jgi:hypothetical protein
LAVAAPALFVTADLPRAELPRALEPRSITVRVEAALLSSLQPGMEADVGAPAAPMNLLVDRVERRGPASFSIFGRIDGQPDSSCIIVVQDQATVALIQPPPGRGPSWRLSYLVDGVHELAPIDPSSFGGCATESGPRPPAGAAPQQLVESPPGPSPGVTARAACTAPLPQLDVMIYYTPAARMEAGGSSAMQAECQMAVDTANQTYIDSFIDARQRLIFRGEISYAETADVEVDRNRLQVHDDGIMDAVHADRDVYGADVVCLFVNDSDPDTCGIAYCLPADYGLAFCVVKRTCASSNFSFAHEVGHLQGCAHNREDAGTGCNQYCDSYGYRFTGMSSQKWRTVMAYDTDPPQVTEYTRIGRFSNPYVMFDGVPAGATGTEGCDGDFFNAATIYATFPSREEWHYPRFEVWVEFGTMVYETGTFQHPWSYVQFAVNAMYSGGAAPYVEPTMWIKAGTSGETLTINKHMTIRACGGIARIGG